MKTFQRITFLVLAAVGGMFLYHVTRPVQPPSSPATPAESSLLPSEPTTSEPQPATSVVSESTLAAGDSLFICSFNIQFLGNFKDRDNKALANILTDYDIVVIQELVAPPYGGTFPDGDPYKPDAEAAKFFDAMDSLGFKYVLSEEDTGSGNKLHVNSSSTEWFVVFFRSARVGVLSDLPSGFLAADRSNHDDYERVPYAFAFRTADAKLDFVLISVHLKPDSGPANRARRKHELNAIAAWIDANDEIEKDFIILGDMNIQDVAELADTTPRDFVSLNDECRSTNTQDNKPYDHVMFNPRFTTEIDQGFDMVVVNLVKTMKKFWAASGPYPGDPYDHNRFRQHYSDHHPVVFRMIVPEVDDD